MLGRVEGQSSNQFMTGGDVDGRGSACLTSVPEKLL